MCAVSYIIRKNSLPTDTVSWADAKRLHGLLIVIFVYWILHPALRYILIRCFEVRGNVVGS
jgi:ACR3 family arsenite efflux pump ArsB